MSQLPSLLGPEPDLDDVAFLKCVESTFKVEFADVEAESFRTIDDIYEALLLRIPHADRGAIPCPTALAFWQLKRTLEAEFRRPIRPDTDLSTLFSVDQTRAQWRRVQSDAALTLPNLDVPDGCIAFLLMNLPSVFLLAYSRWAMLSFLISITLFIVYQRRLYRFIPAELRTVGDLSRVVATDNFGVFSRKAGIVRTSDVWKTLETVARFWSVDSGPITRDKALIG